MKPNPDSRRPEASAPGSCQPPAGSPATTSGREVASDLRQSALLEMCFFLRLAREWDLRFEKLFRVGAVSKWYSAVGHEAVTVPAATAIEPGDALCTLHRDSGAILRYYLDPAQLAGDLLRHTGHRRCPRADSRELLYRLACQMLGKAEGFSGGYERSYHYGLFREEDGLLHVGMISHLGAMIPVAAGVGLAFRQRGSDRVVLNFIGDGGSSTGDFHEGLNMAAVLRVPLVLIIENNRYAFSTPVIEQYASETLAVRGSAYGIPGVQVDGNDAEAVFRVVSQSVARARRGDGPTLIEAVVGRLRGHSEGDDSLRQVPETDLRSYRSDDPLKRFEDRLLEAGHVSPSLLDKVRTRCAEIVLEAVDKALDAPNPRLEAEERSIYAE